MCARLRNKLQAVHAAPLGDGMSLLDGLTDVSFTDGKHEGSSERKALETVVTALLVAGA